MHLDFLKRFYPDFNGKKILDLGRGRGDFLLQCYREGLDVIGVDINPEYIEISEEKIKNNGFKPNIILAKGEELPFEDSYFDFINCNEVLEHTNNPEKVLSEIYRVLKKDGVVFISIHNRFGMKDGHYKLLFLNWMPRFLGEKYIKIMRKNKDTNRALDKQKISEMHYYTYSKFKKIINKIGFRMKDTRKIQIFNPEMILNPKNQKIILFFKKMKLIPLLILIYNILRKFYYNTFHLILIKK